MFLRLDLLLSLLAKRSRTCPPQERSQQEDPLDSPETKLSHTNLRRHMPTYNAHYVSGLSLW
jgi:hypothetical protein